MKGSQDKEYRWTTPWSDHVMRVSRDPVYKIITSSERNQFDLVKFVTMNNIA